MGAELLIVRGWKDPSPDADAENAGEWDTVDYFQGAPKWIAVAKDLWRLVDPSRADRIGALRLEALRRSAHDIHYQGDHLRELIELLDGLDSALRDAGWLDADLRTPSSRVSETVQRLP